MDWLQVVVLIFGNVAWVVPLWLWNRSESRADTRQIHERIDANSKEMSTILRAIQDEMKDFHGRLCAIEERNRK